MASRRSLEYLVEHQILTYLSKTGIGYFWKNTSAGFHDGVKWRKHASPFAINGTSDILGLTKTGRMIALEVKDLAAPTPEQLAFIKKVQANGGLGAVVRSVDQTKEFLVEWGLISPE